MAAVVGFVVNGHGPVFARCVPDDLWVAAAVLYDGVVGVFGEGEAAVVAVRDAFAAAGAGPGGDDDVLRAGLEAGGVGAVDDGASGKGPVAIGAGVDGDGQFGPVDQVGGDGVAPVHVAPGPAVGVVLVVKVVLAVVPDEAVGVVEPAAAGGEVELLAERFAVEVFGAEDGVGAGDVGEASGAAGKCVDFYGGVFAAPGGDVEEAVEVGLGVGEFDFEFTDGSVVDEEAYAAFGSAGLDGEVEVAFVEKDVAGFFGGCFGVALVDVVDVDVAPAAFLLVEDFDSGGLAVQVGNVPRVPVEGFGAAGAIIGAGGGVDDLAVDERLMQVRRVRRRR